MVLIIYVFDFGRFLTQWKAYGWNACIENRGECRDSIHLVSLYELEEENYTNEEILVWNKVSTEEVRLKRFLKRSVNFLYRQKGLIMNLSDRCDYRRNWIKYIINCFVLFFI